MHATKNRCVVVGNSTTTAQRWLIFMFTCARPGINRSFRLFTCAGPIIIVWW